MQLHYLTNPAVPQPSTSAAKLNQPASQPSPDTLRKPGSYLRILAYCLCLLLTAGVVAPSNATTYYMATTANGGNDANNGLSTSAPLATIARFIALAQAGDELQIRGGVYYPGETFITKSGSPGNYITIRNYPGEVPIFDGQRDNPSSGTNAIVIDDGVYSGADGRKSYLIFDGLVLRNWKRGGFYFGDMNSSRAENYQVLDNIIIRNCLVDYCGQNGITVRQADNIQILNCVVSRTGWDINFGSWSSGINLYNCVGTNITVRNCVSFHHVDVSSYHTDGNGLILDMYNAYSLNAGATVENSLFFENGGAGIAWTRQSNANLNNNTLVDNSKAPDYIYQNVGLALWREQSQGNFTNINIRNNIIYQSGGGVAYRAYLYNNGTNVETTPSSGVVTNNNITGLSGAQNPQFTDLNNRDFSLQASSPMINAGTSSGVPNSSIGFDKNVIRSQTSGQPISWFRWAPDFDYVVSKGGLANCFASVARPQGGGYDIGAYEYNGSGSNGGSAYTLYGDALQNGWTSDGWNTNYNENNTSPVQSGNRSCSVQFTGAWGAWRLNRATSQSTSGYSALKFWAYGANGGNSLQIVVKNGGNEAGRKSFTVTGGSWNEYTISLSEIGSPGSIDEIWIHDGSGGSQNTLYIDNIRLVGSGGGRLASREENRLTLSAYPNPALSDHLTLVTPFTRPTAATVEIQDLGGKRHYVFEEVLQGETPLEIRKNLPAGLYLVNIKTASGVFTLKLIRQ